MTSFMGRTKRGRSPVPIRGTLEYMRLESQHRWKLRTQPDDVVLKGIRLHLDGQWGTPDIRQEIYAGAYEDGEVVILEETLRAGDSYMELGAGIGYITSVACRIVGSAQVTSYEANPELAEVARANARLNHFSPQIVNAALGDAAGDATFYVRRNFWASSLEPSEDAQPIQVPGVSFREELERVRPTYLMMDIEGGETNLLGRTPIPACVRAICVETHPQVTGIRPVQDMLVKLIGEGFALHLSTSRWSVAFLSR
jgi:FkbM family methyltransferase